MCYCPTPTLHLNLALTGDGAFIFSLKKTHSVWFISVLNYGDTENVLINHLLLVIPMSYPCHYTNLCPHKPHKHAHTHTHTHKLNTIIYINELIQYLPMTTTLLTEAFIKAWHLSTLLWRILLIPFRQENWPPAHLAVLPSQGHFSKHQLWGLDSSIKGPFLYWVTQINSRADSAT